MSINKPQQEYDGEYQLVPVDEEQEWAEALVSWIIDVLERSGNLSTRSRQLLLSRLKVAPLALEIGEDEKNVSGV